MKINVKKYGILKFLSISPAYNIPIMLPNLPIRIVKEIVVDAMHYIYLGVKLDRDLNKKTMVGSNAEKS